MWSCVILSSSSAVHGGRDLQAAATSFAQAAQSCAALRTTPDVRITLESECRIFAVYSE